MKIPFLVKPDIKYIEKRNEQRIPFIIHQTMKSQDVPNGMYNASKSWIDNNKEYEYRFYDDKKCQEFILKYFSKDIYIAYLMLYAGAAKADLWRLCILYIHGGVYADIDTVSYTGLSKIINYDDDFISLKAMSKQFNNLNKNIKQKCKITNAFIATIPKHPLLINTINNIVKSVIYSFKNKRDVKSVCKLTGPLMFGKTFNYLMGSNPLKEIEEKTYIVCNKKVRLFLLADKKYFKFRYKNYYNDCISLNTNTYHGKNGSYAFNYNYALYIFKTLSS